MVNNRLKICFMGGNQAGITGVQTVLSCGHQIISAVSYSPELTEVAKARGVRVHDTIAATEFLEDLRRSDLLVCVHGREIVKPEALSLPRLGGINLHPYLYQYRGARPVLRALRDGNFRASVGAHVMMEDVDSGDVLVEEFLDVSGATDEEQIYERLYPVYGRVLTQALQRIMP